MSFSFGLAIFVLLLIGSFALDHRILADSHLQALRKLLGIFTAANFYFVLVFHITKLSAAQYHGVEVFLLLDGGVFTSLFWWVQIGLGNFLALLLLFLPSLKNS